MKDKDHFLLEDIYSEILLHEATNPDDIFDSKDGIGAVPNNQDIDYFGFIKNMKLSEFRNLVPRGVSGPKTKDYIIKALRNGEKLGPPFLECKWMEDKGVWKVMDHEGRSRVDALSEIYGWDFEIPVHIFPRGGMRARSITDEMKNAKFIRQD